MEQDSSKILKKYMNIVNEAVPTLSDMGSEFQPRQVNVEKTSLSGILSQKIDENQANIKNALAKVINNKQLSANELKVIKKIILLLLRQTPSILRTMK